MQTTTTSNLSKTKQTEDGEVFGQSASSKIAFHGADPTDQIATIAAVAATAATSSTPFGFAEAQANAIVANLNLVIAALKEKGIIANS